MSRYPSFGMMLMLLACAGSGWAQSVHDQTISRVEVIDATTDPALFPSIDVSAGPGDFTVRLNMLGTPGYYRYSLGEGFRFYPFTVYFFDQGLARLEFECRVYPVYPDTKVVHSSTRVAKTVFLLGGTLYLAIPVLPGRNGKHCDVRLKAVKRMLYGRPMAVGRPLPDRFFPFYVHASPGP